VPICLQNGDTALISAALNGNAVCVSKLLDAKADMEAKDKVGLLEGRGRVLACGRSW